MADLADLSRLDAEARERALDPRESILLQAPAGSGKTTVLTQRFLRLLAEVDEPEQILAITFTRKAAGEMRERVFKALRGDTQGSSAQAEPTRELARNAMARSQAAGWALENSPGRLRIQTIDSLNRWLASRLPIAARAAGDLAILERPLSLYRLAARRTLIDAENDETLLPHVERLFDRLDNDFMRFEGLLTAMLQARSHWLKHLLDADDSELRTRIEASLKAIVDERLILAESVFPAALIAQGAEIARQGALNRQAEGNSAPGPWLVWLARTSASNSMPVSNLSLARASVSDSSPARSLPPGSPTFDDMAAGRPVTSGGAQRPAENEVGAAPHEFSLRHWQALCQLALTDTDTWRSTLTKREGFPTTDKPLKAAALQWIADIQAVPGSHEMLTELASLPNPELAADDALALGSLARLLKLAAAELDVVFQESERVDYPYIAAAARRALVEHSTPTDLALRLGAEVRHILVDEFQDTSIEQYGLLESLTAGWDPGDGRTLFMVGDPMQSIYQFREAEVGLFLRTRERGLGSLTLTPLTLTRNFRSSPHLVEWSNKVFPTVFPSLDDRRSGAVRYLPSVPGRDEAVVGHVQFHRTPECDFVAEAQSIAGLVTRMRATEPKSTIAVLVSARTHAPSIVAALQAAQIPVTGVDLVSLAELAVTRDLAALTRALDHLGDRTAWLAILRAPWCGLTLRDLTALVGDSALATVWECVNDAERIARLDSAARSRLERTRSTLTSALADRDRQELARWVETTWLRLGGPAVCADAEDLDHARAFFNALARWSSEPDWMGPLSLDERLSELYAVHNAAPADAVQIMTIHRAKGLEFDKVIVPGLGRRMRGNTEPLLRWLELPREPDGSDLLMAPIPQSWRRGMEPLNEYLKSLQTRRAAHEKARLLYVAATRARTELHLFADLPQGEEESDKRQPPSGTLLATLWPAISADFPSQVDNGFPATAASKDAALAQLRASNAGSTSGTYGAHQAPLFERLPNSWHLPPIANGPPSTAIPIASYEPEDEGDASWSSDPHRCVARVVREHLCGLARQSSLPAATSGDAFQVLVRERLSRIGLIENDLEQCTQHAAEIIAACLADRRFLWMFARGNRETMSPLHLTGVYEGRLTSIAIDHSFIDSTDTRWLIDFSVEMPNTSNVEDFIASEFQRNQPQLRKSISLVRHLGPQAVRVAMYFPFAQAFVELTDVD